MLFRQYKLYLPSADGDSAEELAGTNATKKWGTFDLILLLRVVVN